MTGIEHRIDRFLENHPEARLRISVGFASVWGLAWLAERTRGRRVELLIGNTQAQYFRNAYEEDRRVAIEFLSRQDVDVYNWYSKQQGGAEAHLKTWIAKDPDGGYSVLAGSANLSEAGLRRNTETMGEYYGEDADRVRQEVNRLFDQSWDAKERVLEYLTNGQKQRAVRPSQVFSSTGRTPPIHTDSSEAAGCWTRIGKRGRQLIISIIGIIVLLILLTSVLPRLGRDGSNDELPSAQATTQNTTTLQTFTTIAQTLELVRAEGVSCKNQSTNIIISGSSTRNISETICSSVDIDDNEIYWECQEIRGYSECWGGAIDLCGREYLGHPISPVVLQGLLIYNEPQSECQGGFDASYWGETSLQRVVPFEEAWASGGFEWDAAKKQRFVADPANLWDTDIWAAPVSPDSDSALLEISQDHRCQIANRWIEIKKKYTLNIDYEETTNLRLLLDGC